MGDCILGGFRAGSWSSGEHRGLCVFQLRVFVVMVSSIESSMRDYGVKLFRIIVDLTRDEFGK